MIRTEDVEYIRSVFTHPKVYPYISDDSSPPAESFEPVIRPDVHYIRPEDGGACFMYHPHSSVMWEVHSAVLPEFRSRSHEFASGSVRWMAENTKAKCLITHVPAGNDAAMRLALSVGFLLVGIVPKSYLKSGVLLDQALLSMEL